MIPIINGPTVPLAHIQGYARTVSKINGWYMNALLALWAAGIKTGVDPTVLAAQCAHETGWGNFGGAVTPQHGNTAGLKTLVASGDMASDHARFATGRDLIPWVGALAQAHHLMLYAGLATPFDSPDERAQLIGIGLFGSAPYVEDLGGKWAPAPDYGTKVAAICQRMVDYAPPA